MLEIEHQFILSRVSPSVPDDADRVRRIRQGYLTRVGPAIRVRAIDGETVMTVKSGSGLVRREVEFEIPSEVAAELFEIAAANVIDKTRYVLGRWEIDVFHGRHDGLLIGEVELEAEDEPMPPVPEGIVISRDVTDQAGFNNQFLASLDAEEARELIAALRADPDSALETVRDRFRANPE